MAGLPNASYIGFTGTPVDKTAFSKGTFKTFGGEDDQGYLHKYSIADSIADGTTLPLYYQLAPNEMLVPHETLDKEFLSLAEIEKNSQRKKQQVEKGLDGLSYFERCKLTEDGITNPEKVRGKIWDAFGKHPGGRMARGSCGSR